MFRRPRRIVLSAAISRSILHHVGQPGKDLHAELTSQKTPCRFNYSNAEAPPALEAQKTTNDEAGGVRDTPRKKGYTSKFQTDELDRVFSKKCASRAKGIEMDLTKLTTDLRKLSKKSRKLRHLLNSNHYVSPYHVPPA